MSKTDEMLIQTVERFQYHQSQTANPNPIVAEFAQDMVDVGFCELWMLTQ